MLITGTHLRTARTLAGLTRAQLAEATELDPSTIFLLESRKDEAMPAKLPTLLSLTCVLEACGIVIKRPAGSVQVQITLHTETSPT